MNIRLRNIPKFQNGAGVYRSSSDWYKYIHIPQQKQILDLLEKYGKDDTYGNFLNNMQHQHSIIWNKAMDNGDWMANAYEDPEEKVRAYQLAYSGNSTPEGINYNTLGIQNAFNNNIFDISGKRTSGDNPSKSYVADNKYSGITDFRRLLGRQGDWDEESQEYKDWIKELNSRGWTMELDKNDNYYKLKRLSDNGQTLEDAVKQRLNVSPTIPTENLELGEIEVQHTESSGIDWSKFREGAQKIFGNPNLLGYARLAGNLINNERVYKEALKGIKPTLISPYHTYRQVVGDEATKQGYYRRAAEGITRASQPFTSDADRQMAYQMEAQRQANELRAQGDLADNQEIRRTSELSSQHADANAQRDNQAANANRASIIDANARIHNLLAQKHSAQWSSIDNILQEIQYRKLQNQAEQKEMADEIFKLQQSNAVYTDPDYQRAWTNYNNILNKHKDEDGNVDLYNEEVLQARKDWNKFLNDFKVKQLQELQQYRRGVSFVKQGGKVTTKKKKDDLLYKSAKDVVEHFRKMSKMSIDAIKKPKEIKLVSHPKGSTKKYQQGGVAPFTIYKPLTLGGETTTTSGRATSSTKSDDGLDLMKELFKSLSTEGLPADVSGIYRSMNQLFQRQQLFGNELSTEDLASMYIQQMQRINNIKFSKAAYDKAVQNATTNDALSEYAIDEYGKVAVQDRETGKINFLNVQDINPEQHIPVTNDFLLHYRAYYAPNDNRILEVVNNGIGIQKIAEFLKAQLPNLGTTEQTIEGYTKKDSDSIKKGLELLQDAPNGVYKQTIYTKSQLEQMNNAVNYLKTILPTNMKNVLQIHAALGGSSMDSLIKQLVGATVDVNTRTNFTAVTGKGASGSSSSSGDNDMIPAVAFFNGLGEKHTFTIQDKTTDGIKIDVISQPLTSKGSNTGSITFDELARTDFGGQFLDTNQATMGDASIAPNGQNNIIVGERIYQAELPIDQVAYRTQGVIKPDFSFLKQIEIVRNKLKETGITEVNADNIDEVNKVYRDNNLPIIYTLDKEAKPVLTSSYARFAMLNATATQDAFLEEPEFNDGVREATNKERKQFESTMQSLSRNSKYKIDNGFWGGTKIYVGTIYIPMGNSVVSALGGTGYKAKPDEYNEMEELQQQADAARQLGYRPQGSISNHQ